MNMNRYAVLLPIVLVGCGATPPPPPPPSAPPAPKLCDFIAPRIDARFKCLETPNMSETGVYGPKIRPNDKDLSVSCLAGKVPASFQIKKNETTSWNISYSREFAIDGSVGLDLSSVASWFPKLTVKGNKGYTIKVTYKVEDATLQTIRNLPIALSDALSSAKTQLKQIQDSNGDATEATSSRNAIQSCIDSFCDTNRGDVIAMDAYVAKPTVSVTSTDAGALDSQIGWKNLVGANFDVKSNGADGLDITAKIPVVLAVIPYSASELLGGEDVCKKRAENMVRDSASVMSKALLDTYQCHFLSLGSTVLNSACPLPSAGAAGSPAATINPPVPCDLCEIDATFPGCSSGGQSLYHLPVNSLPPRVLQATCQAVQEAMNRGAPAGSTPIIFDCNKDTYDWVEQHAANTWRDVLGDPRHHSAAPLQISLIRELLWTKRSPAERARIASRLQELTGAITDIDMAQQMWTKAHDQFGTTAQWPAFAKGTWEDFRMAVLERWLAHFADVSVRGYAPGCSGKHMERTGNPARWDAGDGGCKSFTCLRLPPPYGTAGAGETLAAGL